MWTPLKKESSFAEQFEKRYRRQAEVLRTIEYSTSPETGRPLSVLRSKAQIHAAGRIFELEDVLKEPDGLTDYCVVREYTDASLSIVKHEHKFKSCIEAEIYVVEQLP